MILAQVLRLAQMSRDSFNTVNRRQHLSFIARDQDEQSPEGRYSYRHALALATFVELRRLGVAVEAAIEAVNDSWPHIVAVAEGEAPRRPLCGIRQNQLGAFETLGWPRKDTDEAKCISGAWVSLPEVFATVRRIEADVSNDISKAQDH